MRVERFEVLLRNEATGKVVKRAWTKAELMKGVEWLKRMNARGSDVYIRPAGKHGVILIDGLKAENVSVMWQKGFEPAVTVESSPGVFQAWVALSTRAIPNAIRQLAAEGLARTAAASASAQGIEGYGLLAGFTFAERTTEQGAQRRYALAHKGSWTAASNGSKYLEHIEQTLRDRTNRRQPRPVHEPPQVHRKGRDR